jgi:hypothetical protein
VIAAVWTAYDFSPYAAARARRKEEKEKERKAARKEYALERMHADALKKRGVVEQGHWRETRIDK